MGNVRIIALTAFMMMTAAHTGLSAAAETDAGLTTGEHRVAVEIEATDVVEAQKLYGVWSYNAPAVEFTGSDLLSVMAAGVAAPKIKEALSGLYEKSGITQDAASVQFTAQGDWIANNSKGIAVGKYSLDSQTQSVVFTVVANKNGDTKDVVGRVSFSESGALRLLFEADAIALIVRENSTTQNIDSSLNDILTLVSSYKGVYLGLEMVKK